MDELVLPPDCRYDPKRGAWICGGVELVVGPAEDEHYEEEEERYEDCGSDLIPAELCTEDYEDPCEELTPAELCGEEYEEEEYEEYEEDEEYEEID
jgi:hypothetical protein